VMEVNVMLTSVTFGGYNKTSMLEFWKNLAHELIYNTYLPQEGRDQLRRSPRTKVNLVHNLRTLPRAKKIGIRNGGVEDPIPTSKVPWLQEKGPNILCMLSWSSSMR
jgi:hypothetical protein